ncbi:hypothetical protein QWZ10_25785 [Paracoccus cavernae]|uniref:Uncharacterized protein n=1 Tax=Paracoccus cavernae TaxID=1571207 RepID=A0ABT8DFD8_9RHOB|nr:hypothetical protein [Paracoccus cavernae]
MDFVEFQPMKRLQITVTEWPVHCKHFMRLLEMRDRNRKKKARRMIEQECFTPTQLQYFSNKFTDSRSLAASIPGGKVDSLPTGHVDFLGKARLVELGHNIALQSAWANAPVSFRTELASVGGQLTLFLFVVTTLQTRNQQ